MSHYSDAEFYRNVQRDRYGKPYGDSQPTYRKAEYVSNDVITQQNLQYKELAKFIAKVWKAKLQRNVHFISINKAISIDKKKPYKIIKYLKLYHNKAYDIKANKSSYGRYLLKEVYRYIKKRQK